MIKGTKIIIALLLCCNTSILLGQNSENKKIEYNTSTKGNYLYLFLNEQIYGADSLKVRDTKYFIIERRKYDSITKEFVNTSLKKVENPVLQTSNEVNKYFNKKRADELKTLWHLPKEDNYFEKMREQKDVWIIAEPFKFIELKVGLGYVYLDEEVKAGEVYQYNIIRVGNNKIQEPWGSCIVKSKQPYMSFVQLKPSIEKVITYDSVSIFKWVLPIKSLDDKAIKLDEKNTINAPYINQYWIGFVVTEIKGDSTIEHHQKLFGGTNYTGDSIYFVYSKKCKPGDVTIAYVTPEDEVYNQAINSEQVIAVNVDKFTMVMLKAIKAEEITDGIRLYWNKIPRTAYITGIQITRTDSKKIIDTVALLNPVDSEFVDYNIKPGHHYTYEARCMYNPLTKLVQADAAQTVGKYLKFSKPLPPYDLTANNSGKNILLSWKHYHSKTTNGFYVYRGLSMEKLTVVAGPIRDTMYIDTAQHLSARSNYYYAVIAENLRQDTSIYSNVVFIKPNRAAETILTNDISFYYSNNALRISWKDGRKEDAFIKGFVVQKRKEGDKDFTPLTLKTLVNNVVDSQLVAGINYEYRVANVTTNDSISSFGNAQSFSLPKPMVDLVNEFYVRNVKDAIEISLPAMKTANRKSYTIYRREAAEKSFTKLGTIDANTFSYEDKTAVAKTVYVYAITITETDGREGAKGKSISVRKD